MAGIAVAALAAMAWIAVAVLALLVLRGVGLPGHPEPNATRPRGPVHAGQPQAVHPYPGRGGRDDRRVAWLRDLGAGDRRFVVPKEFHREVCGYFTGTTWVDLNVKKYFKDKGRPVQRSALGIMGLIHFLLRGGQDLDSAFYKAGKGGIGFSIGDEYYKADTDYHDGVLDHLDILDPARAEAAGVRLPPPYPPPIGSDDNIASLTVSTVRRSDEKRAITDYRVPEARIRTIMRWLDGRFQEVQEAPPEAQRLGTLHLRLKDGKVVTVRYYEAPQGEIGFSVDNVHYRSSPRTQFRSSESLDGEIRDLVII